MPPTTPPLNRRTGQLEGIRVRRGQALDLRIGGMSYRAIAQRLGVSRQTAYKDVQAELAVLDGRKRGVAERLRDLELERCDRLMVGLWAQATPQLARDPRTGEPMNDDHGHPIYTTPDVGAVSTILRIMERRAKLLGIDAPVRQEHTGPDGGPIDFAAPLRIVIDAGPTPPPDAG